MAMAPENNSNRVIGMTLWTEGHDGCWWKMKVLSGNTFFPPSCTLATCKWRLELHSFELTLSCVVQSHASPFHRGAGTLPGRQTQTKAPSTTTVSRWNAAASDSEASEAAAAQQRFHKEEESNVLAASQMHNTPFPVSLSWTWRFAQSQLHLQLTGLCCITVSNRKAHRWQKSRMTVRQDDKWSFFTAQFHLLPLYYFSF